MQSNIFSHWLRKLNADMQKAQRKILLLMDNATPHIFEESASFSNITLYYLPPNTTAHLQPCDMGIIYSSKYFLTFKINEKDVAGKNNQGITIIK